VPYVAGGTSFPYHIDTGSGRVTNLRLSGSTLAKIFTNQIVNWDDPAIAADDNGVALPDLHITPVVHAESSGATFAFTSYLASQIPGEWAAFNGGHDQPTEYFPAHGGQSAQNGSDQVINYITSAAGNGSIGIDEYSYPLLANYPVAAVENAAGHYTLPTQYNVAVALTMARINEDPSSLDYQTADLSDVYTNPDPRTYPLSSSSYLIIPTGSGASERRETTARRQTIEDFAYYSICQGQAEIGAIGYSSLPINLVQAGFGQLAKLKQADPAVDLTDRDVTTCNNPTFDKADPARNLLAEKALFPVPCSRAGSGPCGIAGGLQTSMSLAANPSVTVAFSPVQLAATVSPPDVPGAVDFYDEGTLVGEVRVTQGAAELTVPALSAGFHAIYAIFGPDDQSAYVASSSVVDLDVLSVVNPGPDPQSLQTTVAPGSLAISTPYTADNPLVLPNMTLNADGTELTTSGSFGDGTLDGSIKIVDANPGSSWSAAALAGPLDAPGDSAINGQNVGLTGLAAIYAPGNAISPAAAPIVIDRPAAEGVSVGDPGSVGLGGSTPHQFARLNAGVGTVGFAGVLTVNAPSSTDPGTYSGTITFTVS
jgi:ABC-type phosphate transport system substrate-binding protein